MQSFRRLLSARSFFVRVCEQGNFSVSQLNPPCFTWEPIPKSCAPSDRPVTRIVHHNCRFHDGFEIRAKLTPCRPCVPEFVFVDEPVWILFHSERTITSFPNPRFPTPAAMRVGLATVCRFHFNVPFFTLRRQFLHGIPMRVPFISKSSIEKKFHT